MQQMSAGQAYERGLITPDELATCVLAAAERECRWDFEKQSGDPMGEKDYVFSLISSEANDASNMVLTFQIRDTSMFSYTNYGVVYAHATGNDQNWVLKHIVQFLESEPYVVGIDRPDIPLTPDSPKPMAHPVAEADLPRYGDEGVNPEGKPTKPQVNEPPRFPVRISSPAGVGTMWCFVVTIDDVEITKSTSGVPIAIGDVVFVNDDCKTIVDVPDWDAPHVFYYTLNEALENAETPTEYKLFAAAAEFSLQAYEMWQKDPPNA